MIWSRAMSVPEGALGANQTNALVPLLDMANHRAASNARMSPEKGVFTSLMMVLLDTNT